MNVCGLTVLPEQPLPRCLPLHHLLLRATRWTTSFSALTAGRAAERRDYDPLLPGERPAPTASGNDIFSFPRGATPGVCLHQIFETIDFREQDPLAWGAVVESALKDFDFSLEWREPILGMVSDVLQTALEPEGRVRLAEVSRAQRLDEVEFYYPAKTMTLSDLNALLEENEDVEKHSPTVSVKMVS